MDLAGRVKKRIKQLMSQKEMSVYALADKADLTQACIRNWYTKRNYTPSLEAVEKVSRAFDISVSELVRAEDEQLIPVGEREKQLLENWYRLEEKQKKAVLMQMDAFLNK